MRKTLLIITVLLLIYAAALSVYIFKRTFMSDISINTSRVSVIKEIRKLNRLETASFTIEKIIDAGTNGNTFQEFLYGDKILLIAHGDVVAGVDLSKLGDRDVSVNGEEISIRLPKPEIFLTRLDNTQTRVYDRKLGILTNGNKDLEAQARQAAETSIQQAACQAQILKNAKDNAVKQLETLLHTLGFSEVTITATDASC